MAGAAASAASNVAHAVAQFLGFHSPAEEGPGAEADVWAPNLMKMFAAGIEEYTPLVQSALAKAITPPTVNLTPAVQSMVRGATQAVSAVVGSQTQVVHNQNAPLMHIDQVVVRNEQDIYRLSNQLSDLNRYTLRALGVSR